MLKTQVWAILLLTTIAVSCKSTLPADFPEPPIIDICVPREREVNGKKVITHWRCQRTNSQEKFDKPVSGVNVGVSIEDWNSGQAYRRKVEQYVLERCQK